MTDTELDAVYTQLCHTLTAAGQTQAPLLLARFALLAMLRIDDAPALLRMIDQAAADGANDASDASHDAGIAATPAPANPPATRA